MKESYFKKLLSKYISGTINPNEEAYLEKYDHEIIKRSKSTDQIHKDSVWKTLDTNISKDKRKPIIPLYRYVSAASIALLILVGGLYLTKTKLFNTDPKIALVSQETSFGQKSKLTLPDGTKVHLNAGSKVEFPERFSDSIREIKLVGEAFFDVVHNPNKPFIIKTDDLSTKVLGTSFNIEAYPDSENIKITLVTGSVELSDKTTSTIIKPSEQAVFHKKEKEIAVKKVDLSIFTSWRDGIIQFENSTLADAAIKLEKWYGVEIVFENESIKDCTVTGKFQKEDIETVLESIVFVKQNLSYEINKNVVTIKGTCAD